MKLQFDKTMQLLKLKPNQYISLFNNESKVTAIEENERSEQMKKSQPAV